MQDKLIDAVLHHYRSVIGNDFLRYRNHVCRVYHNCHILDPSPDNSIRYAYAAIFHDIGIWTDRTFDYIPPSIKKAVEYLEANDADALCDEITTMIAWHHKISSYAGKYASTVECFRKADWIDVTFGLVGGNHARKDFRSIRHSYPSHGFHRFLLRQSAINALRHPLNPLPMFRR